MTPKETIPNESTLIILDSGEMFDCDKIINAVENFGTMTWAEQEVALKYFPKYQKNKPKWYVH